MSNIELEQFNVEDNCVGETTRGVCDYEGVCENIGRCVLADPDLQDAIDDRANRHGIVALANAYNLGYEKALNEDSIDPLTGFYNRNRLDQLSASFVENAHESGASHMVVVFADLNDFKTLNDGFTRNDGAVVPPSHERGDAALKAWATTTETFIRSGDSRRNPDVMLRFAGDEFVLLLSADIAPLLEDIDPGNFEDMAAYQAARDARAAALMREALSERLGAVPFLHNGEEYIVGASLGIRAIELPANANIRDVIAEVDSEMYKHKQARRAAQAMEQQAEAERLRTVRLEYAVQQSNDGTGPSFT